MYPLHKLRKNHPDKTILLSDPTILFYLTNHVFEPGKRLCVLLLDKEKEPLLILHEMFQAPKNIKTIHYKDTDNSIELLDKQLPDGILYIDENLSAKILIELISSKREFINGSYLIESMRLIKNEDEIKKLKKVSKLNDKIMEELLEHIKEGVTEIELANLITQKQNETPLSGISFPPIVAFSENAANPHATPSNRKLKKGDLILIDMGGTYQHYKSDMTRCFFYKPNTLLESLYNIVLEAQKSAIKAIEIGQPLSVVDKAARDVIKKHGYGQYFIHRCGHGIGLETHEFPDVSENSDTIIKPGMCFSIEPGIYLEGVAGIRIEDLVCVLEDEVLILNKFPKNIQIL